VGATGSLGSTGPNGPNSNTFQLDATILTSGAVIPGTDPYTFYLVNNNSGPATVVLPPANVEGKRILIYVEFVQCNNTANGGEPGNCGSHTVSPQLNLQRQGGDQILNSGNQLVT